MIHRHPGRAFAPYADFRQDWHYCTEAINHMAENLSAEAQDWPPLPPAEAEDTYARLHMWTQIVGEVRLELSPHFNHAWEVPLHVNACGLSTLTIPFQSQTIGCLRI